MQSGAPAPLVYLDNSALGRLSDPDPSLVLGLSIEHVRSVREDIVAVRRIVDARRTGRLRLLSSEVLRAAILQAPDRVQRASLDVLKLAQVEVPLDPTRPLARNLQAMGFRESDALHIAAAYTGGADYAVSCDEPHWLRRSQRVARLVGPGPAIVSPIELLRREGFL